MAIDTRQSTQRNDGVVQMATGFNSSVVTDKATYDLASVPTRLCQVIVWGAGTTWTLDFYDAVGASTRQVWGWVSATGVGVYALQIPCANGLRVVSGGTTAGSCTIVWD